MQLWFIFLLVHSDSKMIPTCEMKIMLAQAPTTTVSLSALGKQATNLGESLSIHTRTLFAVLQTLYVFTDIDTW